MRTGSEWNLFLILQNICISTTSVEGPPLSQMLFPVICIDLTTWVESMREFFKTLVAFSFSISSHLRREQHRSSSGECLFFEKPIACIFLMSSGCFSNVIVNLLFGFCCKPVMSTNSVLYALFRHWEAHSQIGNCIWQSFPEQIYWKVKPNFYTLISSQTH